MAKVFPIDGGGDNPGFWPHDPIGSPPSMPFGRPIHEVQLLPELNRTALDLNEDPRGYLSARTAHCKCSTTHGSYELIDGDAARTERLMSSRWG